MNILRGQVPQIKGINVGGGADIQSHSGRSNNIGELIRNSIYPAAAGSPCFFQRRRYSQAESAAPSVRLCYYQPRGHRIKPPANTFHRGIKGFKVNTQVEPLGRCVHDSLTSFLYPLGCSGIIPLRIYYSKHMFDIKEGITVN